VTAVSCRTSIRLPLFGAWLSEFHHVLAAGGAADVREYSGALPRTTTRLRRSPFFTCDVIRNALLLTGWNSVPGWTELKTAVVPILVPRRTSAAVPCPIVDVTCRPMSLRVGQQPTDGINESSLLFRRQWKREFTEPRAEFTECAQRKPRQLLRPGHGARQSLKSKHLDEALPMSRFAMPVSRPPCRAAFVAGPRDYASLLSTVGGPVKVAGSCVLDFLGQIDETA